MKTRSKINNWDTIRTGQSKLLPIQDCAVPCLVTQSRPILLWFQGLQPTKLLCPWVFSRQEYWNGLPCPPPRDLPNPGIECMSLSLLHWLTGYLPLAPHGKLIYFNFLKNYARENLSLKKNNPFTLQSYLLIYKNRKLTAKKHISPRDGIVSNNLQMWTDIRQSGGKRHRKVVDKKLLAAIEKRIQV